MKKGLSNLLWVGAVAGAAGIAYWAGFDMGGKSRDGDVSNALDQLSQERRDSYTVILVDAAHDFVKDMNVYLSLRDGENESVQSDLLERIRESNRGLIKLSRNPLYDSIDSDVRESVLSARSTYFSFSQSFVSRD